MPLTELQEKWVSALESGKYRQGRGCLSKNGEFCCLGVMCDISGASFTYEGPYRVYGTSREYPPEPIAEMFGLSRNCRVAAMNDDGVSFADIAAFIRKHPDKVFRQD